MRSGAGHYTGQAQAQRAWVFNLYRTCSSSQSNSPTKAIHPQSVFVWNDVRGSERASVCGSVWCQPQSRGAFPARNGMPWLPGASLADGGEQMRAGESGTCVEYRDGDACDCDGW